MLTKAALRVFARLDADSMMTVGFRAQVSFLSIFINSHEDEHSPVALQAAEAVKCLSVVIPAYNEEERLPATLQELIWSVKLCNLP